jgi:hypothetical protein
VTLSAASSATYSRLRSANTLNKHVVSAEAKRWFAKLNQFAKPNKTVIGIEAVFRFYDYAVFAGTNKAVGGVVWDDYAGLLTPLGKRVVAANPFDRIYDGKDHYEIINNRLGQFGGYLNQQNAALVKYFPKATAISYFSP